MESYSSLIGSLASATGYVQINDATRIYYELHGKGEGKPKAVILGGGFCKIGFMVFVLQEMLKQGYEVLMYDTRGLGNSTAGNGCQTTSMLAADCLAVVDQVWGATSHFYYLGLSLGGMVGQELAALVASKGQGPRLLSVYLLATGPGQAFRPPPFIRRALIYYGMLRTLGWTSPETVMPLVEVAVFKTMFSDGYLSATYPGGASGAKPSPLAASIKAADADKGTSQAAGGTNTRIDALRELFGAHASKLLAMHVDERLAVTGQLTSLLSHYLSPAKASAIKAAGIKITVGVTTGDTIIPPPVQQRLVQLLGAPCDLLDMAPGHVDACFLDGVQSVLVPLVLRAWGGKARESA
mmetsp:Transcript_8421/g.18022  ORF Transcript_8421/g.18022 Transcript_8421/m.18022 type:complete len:353 (-) Transcript_8421:590-1648(-)|eukprot:CAMPEP_0202892164 /NCGR_PEP_ID=MMETSP1392-20130828/1962_1 /ASSEMBLY_ACC=CAM_ASM_000868 /TAXON_ID=225041 /ORGANISM="Chlamydomonas chlamydogama, Strain SAG 11-48b" /LENGTH=352 /DNA_ID=CAMNT_0049576049 /DNA_START=112 /DNA_END=1170 /DNA_ORIENTATION=+